MAPSLSSAQNYSIEKGTEQGLEVIRLVDAAHGARVTVMPSLGNRAIEFSIHGKNVLFVPDKQTPAINGIPFLAPWANRLGETGFWANGQHYALNPSLGNYQSENNHLPIHGLLTASNLWRVTESRADKDSAFVTSRLDFSKHPDLLAQWPFAQEYEMTYRLADGELEVRISVINESAEPMPVLIGFHPYYRLPGILRDEWTLSMPKSKAVGVDDRLIPTGEFSPSELPDPLPMKGHTLDNGFTALERDAQGRAHFRLQSGNEALEVAFGPKYQAAVLWEPPPRAGWDPQFICIEPMAAVTDGVNLNHRGKYPELQFLAAGQTWTESFWIRPSGL